MHVIARKPLQSFAKKHADASQALDDWYRLAKSAKWNNFDELKKVVGAVDIVGNFTVFDIKGNHYRLIVDIQYSSQTIFVKCVLTHKEYDKNDWKKDPYY